MQEKCPLYLLLFLYTNFMLLPDDFFGIRKIPFSDINIVHSYIIKERGLIFQKIGSVRQSLMRMKQRGIEMTQKTVDRKMESLAR